MTVPHNNTWTPARIQMLIEMYSILGYTLRECAAKLGVGRSAIQRKLAALNVPIRPRAQFDWTDERNQTLIALFGKSETLATIADYLETSYDNVRMQARKLGLNRRVNYWSDQELDIITTVLTSGGTFDQAVELLPKRTKSSIQRKAYELKLRQPRPVKLAQPKPDTPRTRIGPIQAKATSGFYAVPELEETTDGIAFLDVKYNECKWIIGKQRCCGKPILKRAMKNKNVISLPYCKAHYKKAIRPEYWDDKW